MIRAFNIGGASNEHRAFTKKEGKSAATATWLRISGLAMTSPSRNMFVVDPGVASHCLNPKKRLQLAASSQSKHTRRRALLQYSLQRQTTVRVERSLSARFLRSKRCLRGLSAVRRRAKRNFLLLNRSLLVVTCRDLDTVGGYDRDTQTGSVAAVHRSASR